MISVADMDAFVQVYLLSAVPFVELRVGIPYGIAMGLSPFFSVIAGVLGTTTEFMVSLALFISLRSLRPRFRMLEALYGYFDRRAKQRSERWLPYGSVGLVLAVALPIPGTGAWTGIAIAQLLGLPMQLTVLLISLGIGLSGTLVGMIATGVFSILGL